MSAKVNLWIVPGHGSDTAMARRYSKLPPSRNPSAEDFIWVPISIIEHTSRNVGGHHIVSLPQWFAEKEGL